MHQRFALGPGPLFASQMRCTAAGPTRSSNRTSSFSRDICAKTPDDADQLSRRRVGLQCGHCCLWCWSPCWELMPLTRAVGLRQSTITLFCAHGT